MKDQETLQGIWRIQAQKISQTPGGLNLWQTLLAKLDILSFRPQRIEKFEQKEVTAPDGSRQWILKNSEIASYVKLDEQEWFLWENMDGTKTVQDLFALFSQKFEQVSPYKLSFLLDKLLNDGFLTVKKVTIFSDVFRILVSRTFKNKIFRLFNRQVEIKNLDPSLTWLYRRIVRIFYTPPSKVALALIALGGAGMFILISLREKPDFLKFANSYALGIIAFFLLLAVLVFFHELGHAFSVKHYGREIRKGGVILCLFYPMTFYVNTDDMWMEDSKKAKIAVSWAGLFVNLIFGGTCSFVAAAAFTGPMSPLFYTAALISYVLFFININPFMASDGYLILSDLLGISNLRMRSADFARTVLPQKLKLIWFTKTSGIRKALRLRTKQLPISLFFVGTSFSREEKIFVFYRFFVLGWSLAGTMLAVGSYVLIFNIVKNLWSRPNIILKISSSLIILALGASLAFIVYRAFLACHRIISHWLKKYHLLEDARSAHRFFFKLWSLALAVPLVLALTWGHHMVIRHIVSLWFIILQTLTLSLALFYCRKIWLGDEPMRRKILFQVLFASSGCFLATGLGEFMSWRFGNLDLIGPVVTGLSGFNVVLVLIIGFLAFSLNGMEGGNVFEKIAMGALILGTPLLAGLLAVLYSRAGLGSVIIMARVGFTAIALISVVLCLPTLFTFIKTELKIPWLYLFFGLMISMAWNVIWLLGFDGAGYPVRLGLNAAGLASGSFLALGTGFYDLIYGRGRFERKKREKDFALPPAAKMREAFRYTVQAMVDTFVNFYGRRSLASLEKEYNRSSLQRSLEVTLTEGRIKDDIRLSTDMVDTGRSYREALQHLTSLISEKTGMLFCQKILNKLYDELYWDERELLTLYVFRGIGWGAHFIPSIEEEGIDPRQLLPKLTLFFDFSAEEISEICSLLKLEKYGPDKVIIQQGVEGDRMYIIRSGRLDVFKSENGSETRLDSMEPGDYFGEAALLKEGPRNATVKSVTNVELFVLEKKDFYRWVKPRVSDPQQLLELMDKERFLKKVSLFSGLTPFQRSMLTSRFRSEGISAGGTIMRQGEEADKFYIITRGVVDVTQATPDGKTISLGERGAGESLGEIALIQGGLRTATVIAKTDVKLLALAKDEFDAMMARYLSVRQKLDLVASRRKRLDRERRQSALSSSLHGDRHETVY